MRKLKQRAKRNLRVTRRELQVSQNALNRALEGLIESLDQLRDTFDHTYWRHDLGHYVYDPKFSHRAHADSLR